MALWYEFGFRALRADVLKRLRSINNNALCIMMYLSNTFDAYAPGIMRRTSKIRSITPVLTVHSLCFARLS